MQSIVISVWGGMRRNIEKCVIYNEIGRNMKENIRTGLDHLERMTVSKETGNEASVSIKTIDWKSKNIKNIED